MDYFEDPHLCLICFGYHPLKYCKYFKTFTVQQRIYLVRVHRYCPQCFSRSHLFDECTLMAACDRCHGPHHTMLHADSFGLGPNEQSSCPASASRGNYRRQAPTQLMGEQPLHHRCRLHRVSHASFSRYNEEMHPDRSFAATSQPRKPAAQHSCRGHRVPEHTNINWPTESEEQQQPTSTMQSPCRRAGTVPNISREFQIVSPSIERPVEGQFIPISARSPRWGPNRYTPPPRDRFSDNDPNNLSSATYRWLHSVQQTDTPSREHLYEPCCNDYNCPSRSSPQATTSTRHRPSNRPCRDQSSSFSALNRTWLESQPEFESSLRTSNSERSCDAFSIGATPPVGRCTSDAGLRRLSFSTRRSQPPSTESDWRYDLPEDRLLSPTTLRDRSPLKRHSTEECHDDVGDETGGSSLSSKARAPLFGYPSKCSQSEATEQNSGGFPSSTILSKVQQPQSHCDKSMKVLPKRSRSRLTASEASATPQYLGDQSACDKPMKVLPKRSRSRLTASEVSAIPQYLGDQSASDKPMKVFPKRSHSQLTASEVSATPQCLGHKSACDKPMKVLPKRSRSRLTASEASAAPQYLGDQSDKPKKEPSSEEESAKESVDMIPTISLSSPVPSGKRVRKRSSVDPSRLPIESPATRSRSQESVKKIISTPYLIARSRRMQDPVDPSNIPQPNATPKKTPPPTPSPSATKPPQTHVLQLHEIKIYLQQLLSHLKSPKEYWHTPANRRRQQLMRQQLFQLKCLLRQLIQDVADPRPRCCSPTCTCQQQKSLKTFFQQLLQPLQQCRNLSSSRQLHSCIQQLIEQIQQQQQCQDMPPVGGCAAEDRFQDLLEQLQKLELQCQTSERGQRVDLVQQRLRLQIILRQLLKAALDQLTEVLNVVTVPGEGRGAAK